MCCAFRKIPREAFPPGVLYIFIKIPPLPLTYPRGDGDGDRFPQKIHIPRGGNSEDITVFGLRVPDYSNMVLEKGKVKLN